MENDISDILETLYIGWKRSYFNVMMCIAQQFSVILVLAVKYSEMIEIIAITHHL